MMNNKIKTSILLVVAAVFMGTTTASAANLASFPPNEDMLMWKVKWAPSSSFNSNGGHAFWNLLSNTDTLLPGLGNEIWWFTPEGSGLFVEGPDPSRTAKMTGQIQRRSGGAYVGDIYDVDINFDMLENYDEAIGSGDHDLKLELSSSAYVPEFGTGGPDGIQPRDWRFYHLKDGTVTNSDPTKGDYFELAQAPTSLQHVTQVGIGASNKNLRMGLSTWYTSTHFDKDGNELGFRNQGDINVNLRPMPIVPVPAAVWAGLPVLVALGIVKRGSKA